MRVPAQRLRQLIVDVLTAWGMDAADAEITAEVMVDTDLAGIDSHGVSMLMTYENFRAEGTLLVAERPVVRRENAATALVDARRGLGHPASATAMRMAIDKARSGGVGVVSVVNSHHFGAAGYYAQMAAERGLVGLVTSSANLPCSPPTGSVLPRLATNPIAFAAPAARNPDFLLDIATTTAAVNKVKVHGYRGEPLPEGWVVDDAGEPVTDPVRGLRILRHEDAGGLTPLGGSPEMGSHKGYGLSMMAHILAATLCGGTFPASRDPERPQNIGHFFLAVDPTSFRSPGQFEDDLDDALDVLHGTPPLDPAKPVLVAGDPQDRARHERAREGIPVPGPLAEQLRELAGRAGVDCDL
ncbi:Ldh family oxidoreductase [Saccharopolyspora griseoalba]|uniref:Ldh family oxidoreductase n=1 Tax=Saccharopolyspora griseoalba TaxID=1431848 RepID=A0ABW2LF46_9PSEU